MTVNLLELASYENDDYSVMNITRVRTDAFSAILDSEDRNLNVPVSGIPQ